MAGGSEEERANANKKSRECVVGYYFMNMFTRLPLILAQQQLMMVLDQLSPTLPPGRLVVETNKYIHVRITRLIYINAAHHQRLLPPGLERNSTRERIA